MFVTVNTQCLANESYTGGSRKFMLPRMMSGAACLMWFLMLVSLPAHAQPAVAQQQVAALSGAIAQVLAPLTMGEALVATCGARQPQRRAEYKAAFDVWRHTNNVEAVEPLLNDLAVRVPGITALRTKMENDARNNVGVMVGRDPTVCDKLALVLGTPLFAIRDRVAQVQSLAQTLNLAGQKPATIIATAQPSEFRFYSLTQLSALGLAAMDRAGTFEQGLNNNEISVAREKLASAAVKALGPIATGGRVIKDDEFQEWRGEQQSVFSAMCHSFADQDGAHRMMALKDQEVVVIGEVSSAYQTRAGISGVILQRCRFVASAASFPKAQLPETNGLKLRPPSPAESYAGPGRGFSAAQIAQIAFTSKFSSRMDGFGNGYVRRQEHTYLLLVDGTAYEHHWPFPFTDLNIETVKRRDVEFWYRWEKTGGRLILIHTGGADNGKRVEPEKYDTLAPLPRDTKFAGYYYFEDVGMGGAQFKRGYNFRADGTVELTRESFVAGKTGYGGTNSTTVGQNSSYSGGGPFGQGFFSAVGPSGKVTARYRIDGYVLELINDQNVTERHFIARFGAEGSNMPPKNLYLDGQALWSSDGKQ